MNKVVLFFLLLTNSITGCKHFVLISAPGSGKGTFSEYLVSKYNYVQISPGDIFRREINKQTEFGKKIQAIIEKGEYVDESIVRQLVTDNIAQALKQNKPFILEGFPHSVDSFKFLHTFFQDSDLSKDVCFLELLASDEVCMNRILGRQVCKGCSRIYNLSSSPPKEPNKCDECKSELIIRKSDTKDILKSRLKYFRSQIEPIKQAAKEFYTVITIKSEQSLTELKALYDDLLAEF